MCGISGIWQQTEAVDELTPLIEKMSSRLVHRGPDAQGVWQYNNQIALAHRRLSIQDLSVHGSQPMQSPCQRYQLVFNGEIYNFLTLKKQLGQHGVDFVGHSDTEVLLKAIIFWGLDKTLSLVNGMFAFALWDQEKNSLTLAQDRAAKKPLYYGWVNKKFVFASELKAIKCLPGFTKTINRDALTLYLTYNYVPAPHSIYENIFKLSQGCYLTITEEVFLNGININDDIFQYWSPLATAKQQYENPYVGSFADATTQLDQHLHDSIKLRMMADVPVGVLLSGGIDSTVVTAIAQANSSCPVKSFSIGFENNVKSEAAAAKKIAQHLNTEHHELYVSAQHALDVLPLIPEVYDEPFGDSSQIPTFIVCQLAKQKVTVALTGDGGDELFYGYGRYFSGEKLYRICQSIPHFLRQPLISIAHAVGRSGGIENKFLRHAENIAATHPLDLYSSRIAKFTEPERLVIGGKKVALGNIADIKSLNIAEPELNMMLLDYTSYLTGGILVKVDRASMAVSLEARNPLLDKNIVEFAWSLPSKYKYQNGQGKAVLREVLKKYVPNELTDRPKQGFAAPIYQWLSGPLREWADQLLNKEVLAKQGLLNPELVDMLWQECKVNPKKSHSRIWTILMFQAWYQYALADN